MDTQAFDIENLKPELQQRVACFEANKAAYIDLQNNLLEVTADSTVIWPPIP